MRNQIHSDYLCSHTQQLSQNAAFAIHVAGLDILPCFVQRNVQSIDTPTVFTQFKRLCAMYMDWGLRLQPVLHVHSLVQSLALLIRVIILSFETVCWFRGLTVQGVQKLPSMYSGLYSH